MDFETYAQLYIQGSSFMLKVLCCSFHGSRASRHYDVMFQRWAGAEVCRQTVDQTNGRQNRHVRLRASQTGTVGDVV